MSAKTSANFAILIELSGADRPLGSLDAIEMRICDFNRRDVAKIPRLFRQNKSTNVLIEERIISVIFQRRWLKQCIVQIMIIITEQQISANNISYSKMRPVVALTSR